MSIENPKDSAPNAEGPHSEGSVVARQESEMSEEQEQTARENVARESFIREWVMASALTPEQKLFVAEYVKSKPGAWREYNGVDFKVVEQSVEGDVWKVSFGVFFDDYEAHKVDVEIPTKG